MSKKQEQNNSMKNLSSEERVQVMKIEAMLLNAFSDAAEEILEKEKTEAEIEKVQQKINE